MRIGITVILACLFATAAMAQKLAPADRAALTQQEDSLRAVHYDVINGKMQEVRTTRNDQFIPELVKALKTKYSYYYPFDSIRTMAKGVPAGQLLSHLHLAAGERQQHFPAFRRDSDEHERRFAETLPLFDNSDFTKNMDTITDQKGWYGCLYYAIIQKHYFNAEYYTLFGWDANSQTSQKKIAEMLTFKNGQPVFGGPFFSFCRRYRSQTRTQPVHHRHAQTRSRGRAQL